MTQTRKRPWDSSSGHHGPAHGRHILKGATPHGLQPPPFEDGRAAREGARWRIARRRRERSEIVIVMFRHAGRGAGRARRAGHRGIRSGRSSST